VCVWEREFKPKISSVITRSNYH